MARDAEDLSLRLAAFRHLNQLKRTFGTSLRHDVLRSGFVYEDRRIHLMGPQGIFTPMGFDVPLSITTAPLKAGKLRPYDDELCNDGFLRYRYRGTDPHHRDNEGVRRAWAEHRPLIYFRGTISPRYVPVFPVFVVADEPAALTFTMQVSEVDVDAIAAGRIADPVSHDAALLRRYRTVELQTRLHQDLFRDRVLAAYRTRCSVCRLRHDELLDAAHIRPDAEGGEPVVPNGVALCKLHHAAYDADLLGVRPDLRVEVSRLVLEEEDGPMLRHGLQGIHGQTLHVPRASHQKPDRNAIEWRYERFRNAQ
jgi:putative restriction endonuclease